ncbi:MAG: patatin-like phospholipase family protein [Gemmatimonadota bacterium]|nr:patatin-like phospholipase family protein [Gemmatimonadota bacterium]
MLDRTHRGGLHRGRRLTRAAVIAIAYATAGAISFPRTPAITAQEPAPGTAESGAAASDRPRVVLVLGGGGARGLAHVGVLRAFHEAQVPVDAVVGTSMGAIVGGLYAVGLPLDEIEALLATRDWPLLFDDDPPRPAIRLRRKRDERDLLIPLEVGVGPSGLQLPSALLSGDKLLTLLQVYTLHALPGSSFDDQALPYRAVATDARTGERVVLNRGSLAKAMRASAAVPGIFAPTEIDGRELLDGGLVDNLPIDVARALGAEVIIAVEVGSDLDRDPTSAIEFVDRAMTIMIRQTTDEQIATLDEDDWLVVPDLGDVRSTSFDGSSYRTAFDAGLAAGRAGADRARVLAVPEAEFAAWDARRTRGWSAEREFRISSVTAVVDRTALRPQVVTGIFPPEVGDTIGRAELADAVSHVLGYGGFSGTGLTLADEAGDVSVELRPVDKPWGPVLVRSGLTLADRQRGRARWRLAALITHGRINAWGGQLKGKIAVGSSRLLSVEWYQPLEPSERFFGDIEAYVERHDELIPRSDILFETVDVEEIGVGLGTGVRLGAWGELSAGLRIARINAERPAGSDIALPPASNVTSWLGRFEVDILDRPAFPSSGVLLRSEIELSRSFLGGNTPFDRLALDGIAAFSAGSHALVVGGRMGTALGDTLRLGRDFQLGGLFQLTAAEYGSIRGSYAGLGRLIYYFRPGAAASRREGTIFRLGASLETAQAWAMESDVDLGDLLFGFTVFGAVDTPIGPLHAGWAWADERSNTWFFRIGPVF